MTVMVNFIYQEKMRIILQNQILLETLAKLCVK